jgi:hypothetical protein
MHFVPGNKIRSEWVHVQSAGSLRWDLLFLIQCDDNCLYFFQRWDSEPCLCIPAQEITQLVDCSELKPEKHDTMIRIETSDPPQSDGPQKSWLPKVFQVCISISLTKSAPLLIFVFRPGHMPHEDRVCEPRIEEYMAAGSSHSYIYFNNRS